ncbi:MAG: HAMP domain-containing histidine kinase [bacterium]|nr:HAMP domain-containing histidine kinase [bacterium]
MQDAGGQTKFRQGAFRKYFERFFRHIENPQAARYDEIVEKARWFFFIAAFINPLMILTDGLSVPENQQIYIQTFRWSMSAFSFVCWYILFAHRGSRPATMWRAALVASIYAYTIFVSWLDSHPDSQLFGFYAVLFQLLILQLGMNLKSSNIGHVIAAFAIYYAFNYRHETLLATMIADGTLTCLIFWVTSRNYRLVLDDKDAARREAEEASRAKSRFFASVSHELHSPLQAITGYAELITSAEQSPREAVYLRKIRAAGASLSRLLNDVLDMARLEEGRITLNPNRFALRATVRSALAPYRTLAISKGLRFFVSFDPALPRELFADAQRIGQVLINLATNALKFTDAGSIRFRFIHESIDSRSFLKISVQDTGIGLSEAERASVFEPFSQANPGTGRGFGGTGLGLSIVREIAELMQGSVAIGDEKPATAGLSMNANPGTEFIVRLALNQPARPEWISQGKPGQNIDLGIN